MKIQIVSAFDSAEFSKSLVDSYDCKFLQASHTLSQIANGGQVHFLVRSIHGRYSSGLRLMHSHYRY